VVWICHCKILSWLPTARNNEDIHDFISHITAMYRTRQTKETALPWSNTKTTRNNIAW
jgi:hypothetical protein